MLISLLENSGRFKKVIGMVAYRADRNYATSPQKRQTSEEKKTPFGVRIGCGAFFQSTNETTLLVIFLAVACVRRALIRSNAMILFMMYPLDHQLL